MSLATAQPPYKFPLMNTTQASYATDDSGNLFPGNNAEIQGLLDVQCHVQTSNVSSYAPRGQSHNVWCYAMYNVHAVHLAMSR